VETGGSFQSKKRGGRYGILNLVYSRTCPTIKNLYISNIESKLKLLQAHE